MPQRSVLGPLLFILYINDIVNCNNLSAVLFADDAAFLGYHESLKHLQRIMNEQSKLLCQWLITNKLTINVKKKQNICYFINKRIPNLNEKLTNSD